MGDAYSIEHRLRHTEDRIDHAHPGLAEQREPRHPEEGVERVGEIAWTVGKSAAFTILQRK